MDKIGIKKCIEIPVDVYIAAAYVREAIVEGDLFLQRAGWCELLGHVTISPSGSMLVP